MEVWEYNHWLGYLSIEADEHEQSMNRQNIGNGTKFKKINITAKDKTQQAFQGVRGKLRGLKDSIFSVTRCISRSWWWSSN